MAFRISLEHAISQSYYFKQMTKISRKQIWLQW
jgi:hypothetical protein